MSLERAFWLSVLIYASVGCLAMSAQLVGSIIEERRVRRIMRVVRLRGEGTT